MQPTILRLTLVAALAIAAPASAQTSAPITSNMRASDIGGFRLGEPIAEVRARTSLTPLGRGDFEAVADGVSYDFGFTPLGRLYRIGSTQPLGAFTPDRAFTVQLVNRLTEKYGPPLRNQLPDGEALWTFAESYVQPDGSPGRRFTESLEVMVGGGYGTPIELQMKLIDFRYIWADQAALNAGPAGAAEQALKF